MKKLLLGICYCLFSSLLIAQEIRGRITDASTGRPVAAATVDLGQTASTVADNDGRFRFTKVRSGSNPLRVSSIGYAVLDTIAHSNAAELVIPLQRINLFMEPVEVLATRASATAPFTQTNISKREIEKANLGQDLPFLLNQTPSVIINSDAGNGIGYTGIRIRGTDATRINMTINGIPYNDAESQGLFFVNLPDLASSVNNIQIQRGVGTSTNGAGAFGATINFSTNEVNTSPYAELNNAAGSFNTWKHTAKVGSGLLGDHFTIDARISKISSDGYVDRAFTDLNSFSVSGAYLSANTSVRLNVMSGGERTYQAWNGVSESDLKTNRRINYSGTERPGTPYSNETDNYKQDHYQLFYNQQLNSALKFNTALFLTKGKGYYEQYKSSASYSTYGLPDFELGNETVSETDLIRQLWLDNSFFGQVLSVQYNDDKNDLIIGGGWNKYAGQHFGKIIWAKAGVPDDHTWYDLPADKSDVNVYTKYQRVLVGGLEAFVDLQYRRVNYKLYGFRENPEITIANTYNFFNPKVGLSYVAGNMQVYASYSQATKEPVRDDFEAGANQQPTPEQLHDFELGWELKNPRYNFASTFYYMLYRDQLVLTGAINDVGAYTRTNTPRSFRVGIELQGRVTITNWLSATANATLSRNRIENYTEYYDDYDNGGQKTIAHGNTDISFSPSLTAAASLEFQPTTGLQISLPAKYVSRQYLDNTSDKNRSLNAFYVQDLRLAYSVKIPGIKNVQLIVQVNNIFNKQYEPNGYTFSYLAGGALTTENYYFPMAGTNLMAGVNVKL